MSLDADGPGLALGTAQGIVKRVTTDYPSRPDWEVVALRKDGDRVVGAAELSRRRRGPRLRHLRRPAAALPRRRPSGRRVVRPVAWPASGSLRAHGHLLRRGRPGRRRRRRHLVRLLRRAARHPARRAQGHPLRRVPRQGPRHRRRSRPPLPQGRGHPRARLGRRPPARASGAERRRRSSCPRPPASATAPGTRRHRRRVIAEESVRRCADACRVESASCYAIVTGPRGAGPVALACVNAFTLVPVPSSPRPTTRLGATTENWRRAMALNSKRRIAGVAGVLAVALTATACGSSDDERRQRAAAVARAASTARPTRRSVT